MKKLTLLLTVFISAFFVNAEVLLTETFDYTAGADLSTISGWTTTGTIDEGKGDGRIIEALPLTYSNDGGEYILSGVGKALNNNYQAGNNYISYKSFNSVNSGVVYLSFLYKVYGDQGQSNSEIIGMSDKNSNSAVKPWAGKQSGGTKNPFRLGVTRASTTSSDIQWGADAAVEKDNVYLIVLKYDFTAEKASLFIDPEIASATEPATPYVYDDSKSTAKTSLGYLMFKHSGSSIANFIVGGVRVSTTWAEAVAKKVSGLPQLETPTVGTASEVGAESFTANWTAVAGATGYIVKVYEGENIIGTYTADGQATESLKTGSGLWANTNYTYTVAAKGDGTTTGDSDESTASAPFTTTSGLTSITTDFGDDTVWGEATATDPGLDNYPSSEVNGYILKSAFLRTGSTECLKGNRHVNRIAVDKNTHSSSITLPIVQSIKQIEIHATSGSDGKGFKLEKTVDGKTWETVGTYTTNKTINISTVAVSSDDPIKFRIANNTTSALYVWQIITRTTNPALLTTPTASAATAETKTGFTTNWVAVENATGYNVRVYNEGSLVNTYPVDGQAVENYVISDLDANTEYTYKVQAIGDGDVDYLDSYNSDAITVKTLEDAATSLGAVDASKVFYAINNIIHTSQAGTLEIYDLSGAKVLQTSLTSKYECGLAGGLYIARLKTENGNQYVQKIRIQ